MEKNILIQKIDVTELKNIIQKSISEEFTRIRSEFEQKNSLEELLSRKETAELLSISFPTLGEWSKMGVIRSYKLGNRVYYKRSEIFDKLESSSSRIKNI